MIYVTAKSSALNAQAGNGNAALNLAPIADRAALMVRETINRNPIPSTTANATVRSRRIETILFNAVFVFGGAHQMIFNASRNSATTVPAP